MYNRFDRTYVFAFILSVVSALSVTGATQAGEFSANSKQSMPGYNGSSVTTVGKIFIKGQIERNETASPIKQISIIRPDKGVTWILNPAQKTYIEMQVQPAESRKSLPDKMKHITNFKKAGTAKVAGYLCDKYTYNDKKINISGAVYISPKLNYQLKADTQMFGMNTTFELSNIKEGKQAESLFNIPKGYKKVKLKPFKMPGMGGKGMPKFPGADGSKQHLPK